ncbi:hypothetical protein LPJ73_003729, partial [Coemansia sp. RSA 2703]
MFSSASVRVRRRAGDDADAETQTVGRKKVATGRRPAWLDGLAQRPGSESADSADSSEQPGDRPRTLVQSERHAVALVGGMPAEASALVAQAQADGRSVAGGSSAQHAFVATAGECIVWAYGGAAQRLQLAHDAGAAAPVVVLVRAAGGVAGVLACGGRRLRYWADAQQSERFVEADAGVRGDMVVRGVQVQTHGVALATAGGRLLHVTLGDMLAVRAAGGLLDRVARLLGDASGAVGLAAGRAEAVVLARGRVQRWAVSRAHGARAAGAEEVACSGDAVDVAVADGTCVLLRDGMRVGVAGPGEAPRWLKRGVHGWARLAAAGGALFVVHACGVLAVVVADGRVAYEAAVALRPDDAVLGFGVACTDGGAALDVVCRSAGVLRVSVDVARALAYVPADGDAEHVRACAAQLEQAVVYGGPACPLSLGVDAADAAHVQPAALAVARRLAEGGGGCVDVAADVRVRFGRVHRLAEVLEEHALMPRIDGAARVALCSVAEQLAAAAGLWALAQHADAQPLADAAAAELLAARGVQAADAVRQLVRRQASLAGDLVCTACLRADADPGCALSAARLAAAVLQPALAYRAQHAALYALPHDTPCTWWTATPQLAAALAALADRLFVLCGPQARATPLPGDLADCRLRTLHDAEVASAVRYAEHDALGEPAQCLADVGALALRAADRAAGGVRARLLVMLAAAGLPATARALADELADMPALATLLLAAPRPGASSAEHVRLMLRRHGQPFALALFAVCALRRAWATLLRLPRLLPALPMDAWLADYLRSAPAAHVAWVHYLASREHDAAKAQLLSAARDADVGRARVLLSLAKLAAH